MEKYIIEEAIKSNSSSSFQIILDVFCVLIIKPLQFLVEFLVSLIDVVNVCVVIMHPSATVLFSFGYLGFNILSHLVNSILRVFVDTMDHRTCCGIKCFA